MNQRIQELAEQARGKDPWSIEEGKYLTNYLDEKKFAELIIRECADLADNSPFGHDILKHFGITNEQSEECFFDDDEDVPLFMDRDTGD